MGHVRIIEMSPTMPEEDAIDAVVRALDSGAVVAVPTDTIYALVADVSYAGSADRLFALKKRSRANALPVMVADIEQALSITVGVPDAAHTLMEKFWPGPLTIVLPQHPDFVADLGSDDDETIGVRCPDNLISRLLCEEVGPLATTSANRAGEHPATTPQEVRAIFGGGVDVIVDGGICDGYMATVIDFTGSEPKLLREGQIAWSDITAVLG